MVNFMWTSAYRDFLDVMMTGEPPLYLRLLIVNAVFVAAYIWRRNNGGKPLDFTNLSAVQLILIALNCGVALSTDVAPQYFLAGL
jgi:hypothetical protein